MADGEVDPRRFGFAAEPDADGWFDRPASSEGRFGDIFGLIRVRREAEGMVRARFPASSGHRNINEVLHGGYIMAAIDHGMFVIAAARAALGEHGGVTLDCTTSFMAPGRIGPPIDVLGRVLRETGRTTFVQGIVEQEGEAIAAFTGTLRKSSR